MSPTDCVDVVEFLAARCPAMRMHENTPDAWYVDLAEYDRDDALEAVRECSRREPFVSLAALVAECRAVRGRRIGRQRQAALQAQIAAENPPAEALTGRPLRALMAGTPLRSVPRADWHQRHTLPPRPPKPPLTDAELEAARRLLADAELSAAFRSTPDDATARTTGKEGTTR